MANPMLSVMCALHAKSTCTATGDICSLSERVDAPIRIELHRGFIAWSESELSTHQAINPSCMYRRRDD